MPGMFKASMEDVHLTSQHDEVFMVLPLIARESSFSKGETQKEERRLGVISIYRESGKPAFTTSELGIVQTISSFAAIALEKAELYRERSEKRDMEQELDIARSIQEGLLPAEMPVIKGMSIAAASIPAKTIGGDFYDFINSSSRLPGFMIADVSGKGVSAALLTNMARSAFRGISCTLDSPGDVIARVNSFLCNDIDPYRFITLFYMTYNPDTGILCYSNAGHSPALVCSKEGNMTECTTPGPAIGIMPDIPYSNGEIGLEKGDIVVLYTDGITESRSKDGGSFYGLENLKELILNNRHLNVSDLKMLILKELEEFSGNQAQHDDLTLVIIKID
jgi:sigma-B regulation protein RsbU (phosphoserine phosphatase)